MDMLVEGLDVGMLLDILQKCEAVAEVFEEGHSHRPFL